MYGGAWNFLQTSAGKWEGIIESLGPVNFFLWMQDGENLSLNKHDSSFIGKIEKSP